MTPRDIGGSPGDLSPVRGRDSSSATERPAMTAGSRPARHVGSVSWSWVPGVCSSCGAFTTRWAFTAGGPPWLGGDPHARLHLRLLWGFYASSLPSSCAAMREALRVGALSALRAEATLLSLLSRGFGFTCLSLSARRLAELCDIQDAEGPNLAWGPQNPLGAAGGRWGSPMDSEEVGKTHASGDGSSTGKGNRSKICTMEDILISEEPFIQAPGRAACISEACFGHGERSHAIAETSVTSPTAPATLREAAGGGLGSKGACSSLKGPTPFQSQVLQQPQPKTQQEERQLSIQQPSQHKYGDQRERYSQNKEQEGTHHHHQHGQMGDIHQFETHGHRQWLQQQPQCHRRDDQQPQAQQQQKQQDAWERVEALRREISASGIHRPGHPVYEALAACLVDLHAAKDQLGILFQDTAASISGKGEAALSEAEKEKAASRSAIETREDPILTGSKQHQKRHLRVGGPSATGAAIVAATAGALGRLAASGRAVAGVAASAVPRLQWPPSTAWECLTGLPRRVVQYFSQRAKSAAAAAAAAAQTGYSLTPIRSLVLLGEWVWGAAAADVASEGGGPCFAEFNITRGPLLLQHLLQAAERETVKRWEKVCHVVRWLLLPLAAAQQQLHQLQQALLEWQIPGLDSFWDSWAIWGPRYNSNTIGSPWATPEGLRRGASTSTCYWSPAEGPPAYSRERLLAATPSVLTLPPRQLQQQIPPQSAPAQKEHQYYTQQAQKKHEPQPQQHQPLREQMDERRQQHGRRAPQSPGLVAGPWTILPASHVKIPEPPQFTEDLVPTDLEIATLGTYRHPPSISTAPAHIGTWRRASASRIEEGPEVLSPDGGEGPTVLSGRPPRSLSGGPPSALRGGPACKASFREVPEDFRRNMSFRSLSQAAAATRAAAAGAAAAAATASWGAAIAARPRLEARRGPPRHVSFVSGTDEALGYNAVAPGNWNASETAAAVERGPGARHSTAARRYNSIAYTVPEDSDSCWAGPPTGPHSAAYRGTPHPTATRRYSSSVYTRDDSGSCREGPATGPRLGGPP